jgi:hypothetical protein
MPKKGWEAYLPEIQAYLKFSQEEYMKAEENLTKVVGQ